MNKVDQLIKQQLMTYPTLYSCRMDVLQKLFMANGNGYEWDAHGCLSCDELSARTTMDYSDLDKRKEQLDRDIERDGASSPHLATLYAGRAAALKRLYAERRLIEADIDLYAQHHVMGENYKSGVEWMGNFDLNFCNLSSMPFASIDSDWAAAAEETVKVARNSIWRYLGMHSPFFERDNADPAWLKVHDALGEILDKLDATTGSNALEARLLAATQRHLDKLLPRIAAES